MIDRSRRSGRARRIASALLVLIATGAGLAASAGAEEVPAPIYIGRDEIGSGGGTLYLTATALLPPPSTLILPIWMDASAAAGGEGISSIQDVVIRNVEPTLLALLGVACSAPSCRLGASSDSEREILLAVGDDTAALPSLTGRVKIAEILVANLYGGGRLELVSATALDANGNGDLIGIASAPNEGVLVEFLPEPGFAAQVLAGIGGLGVLGRRRRRLAGR